MTDKNKPQLVSAALNEFLRRPDWAAEVFDSMSDTDITILKAAAAILTEHTLTWVQPELPFDGVIPVRFADREDS